MSESNESSVKLTKAQRAALTRIRDRGPEAWIIGCRSRAGSISMFQRMIAAGLCTRAPHNITDAGRAALEAK